MRGPLIWSGSFFLIWPQVTGIGVAARVTGEYDLLGYGNNRKIVWVTVRFFQVYR